MMKLGNSGMLAFPSIPAGFAIDYIRMKTEPSCLFGSLIPRRTPSGLLSLALFPVLRAFSERLLGVGGLLARGTASLLTVGAIMASL